MEHHVLERFYNIIDNLSTASLGDVNQLLNYYNGNAVMINGTSYHPFNDPSIAARLNARYHELTGKDHPRFVEQTPAVIDRLMKDKDMLIQAGAYTPMYFDTLEQIKENITGENTGIEITEQHHPLQDFYKVLNHLESASLEEVEQQLNYYNGNAVMINGTSYHPFNDPSIAARLNARYHELTGKDHPRFVEQTPAVIDRLMKDKDMLIQAGAYTPMYFDTLEQIKENITGENTGIEITEQHHPRFIEESKKVEDNMENQNEITETQKGKIILEKQKRRLAISKKIRELLNEGNFVGILPFLSKEDREDFIDVITESFDERNSKLFWRKLEAASAENNNEAEQRRIEEDIQEAIAMEDLKRSKSKASFRTDMSRQLQELNQQNANGQYLTIGDRHFLEDNDEKAYFNSEQSRMNKERQNRFDNMEELGRINNEGDNNINRRRTIDSINRLIREKQAFIASGGDLNNCSINFDQKIQQLYSILDDTKKMDDALEQQTSHKMRQ